MSIVKDFIYIDAERLKSLYSQVFKGVVEAIVETELSEEEKTDTQPGGRKFSGSTIEGRVAAATYKAESKLLYDHMYNLLEQKIASAITDTNDTTVDDYEKKY
jgi:hypothetical protein